MRAILLVLWAVTLAAADPVIGVETVRMPIAGRMVRCFAVYADQVLATSVTVTIAYGGSASSTTDFTATTSVVLPAEMPTNRAIFVAVRTTNLTAAGKTVTISLQTGTGYTVDSVNGVATATIAPPLEASEVYPLGEPNVVEVAGDSSWTYELNVHRPAQLVFVGRPLPVHVFNVQVEAAPGASDYSSKITAVEQAITESDKVPFLITMTTHAGDVGKQFRFRLKIRVDVDGDQNYVPYQTPGPTGIPSEDIFTEQDIVVQVTIAGPG